jgi:hypothetical protein
MYAWTTFDLPVQVTACRKHARAGIVVRASTAEQLPESPGPPRVIIETMPARKKPADEPLDPYRRIRKPVPPPQRVIPDRRRKIREDQEERERRNPER